MQPILSILICSLWKRAGMLASLLSNLEEQISRLGADGIVEVRVNSDHGETPTGTKRNILLQEATGMYSTFVDDDDVLPDYYIEEILKAAETDCDAMAINGVMTTDGGDEKKWYISKNHPYIASRDDKGNEIYLRYQNHISPIKRAIASQFLFPDIYQGEDYAWATQIKNSGLIKTETKIEKPLYHYKFVRLK